MECNKDDAIKAKVVAEQKLTEKNFVGARSFALKAQTLYPGLETLSQLMTTIDVYITAEKKISGETDWYGILGVNPTADDETLKKQYRKLALVLHPDKNKFAGADGAFRLLSEAWTLLSDKPKRLAYNQRRSFNVARNTKKPNTNAKKPKSMPQTKKSSSDVKPPKPTNKSSSDVKPPKPTNKSSSDVKPPKPTKRSSSNVKPPKSVPQTNPTWVHCPPVQSSNTFWTTCQHCKMHYEYIKIYLNQTLLCPSCRQGFKAIETAPPSNYSKPPNPVAQQKQQKPAPVPNHSKPRPSFPHQPFVNPVPAPNTGLGGGSGTKFPHVASGKTSSVGTAVSSPSTFTKAAKVVQQANEKMKRAREESWDAGEWGKKKGPKDMNGYVGNIGIQLGRGNKKVFAFAGVKHVPMSTRELTPAETRNMLIKKTKTEIIEKLSQLTSEGLSETVDSNKVNANILKRKSFSSQKLSKNGVSNNSMGGDQAKKLKKTSMDADNKNVTINVPDPDFYEFDQDRMESSFSENQVWAAYADDDGMPRFYAMVHEVVSLKPFKMRVSWLAAKSNSEFSNMNWASSGFYKSCGEFKVGRSEFTESLNSFSHKVKWVKAPRGSICILPKKGEVWALYRNWSRDWNKLTPDKVIHQYDMVLVLRDYNEEQGVSVAPLMKADGFRTVFRACTGPEYIQVVAKEEMLRFSHQVPNHLLTGEEAKDAPKGLLELDPASTPFELIPAVAGASEKKNEENMKKFKRKHIIVISKESRIGVKK